MADTDRYALEKLVRHAAAMAVQDAAAHMRNVNTIASAALGAAHEMILDNQNVDQARAAIAEAQAMVTGATQNFLMVADAANRLLASPNQP
ncbi:MAG TPA: hypothetical protein VGG48_12360 [Rhizomicrobium sp.]|jgi:hypothetical protein